MNSHNNVKQEKLSPYSGGIFDITKRNRDDYDDIPQTGMKKVKKHEIEEKEQKYHSPSFLTPYVAKKIKDTNNSIHNAPKKNYPHRHNSYIEEDLNDVKRALNFGSCDKIDEYPIVSDFSSVAFLENSFTETHKKGNNQSGKLGYELNVRYSANFGEQRK